jgi:hypothetical protein
MDFQCPVCNRRESVPYLDGDDNEISLASVCSPRTLRTSVLERVCKTIDCDPDRSACARWHLVTTSRIPLEPE